MSKFTVFLFLSLFACSVQASWYWPFESTNTNEVKEVARPRLSDLMEPISFLIDDASDIVATGKTASAVSNAIEKYREALDKINQIELENEGFLKEGEKATIKNKRAYVNATIDALLLNQVKQNAKAVAVSDTTELEKKLADERKKGAETNQVKRAKADVKTVETKVVPKLPKPRNKREQVMADILAGDFTAAELLIKEMLEARPNSATALNLKAVLEQRRGNLKAAEAALDQAISSHPKDYHAYYNLALLYLQKNPDNKDTPRRYYETGRAQGGPENLQLEEALK